MNSPQYMASIEKELRGIMQSGLAGGAIQFDRHQLRGYEAIGGVLEETHRHTHNLIMACGTGKTWMEVGLLVASERAKAILGMSHPDLLIYTENAIRTGIIETLDTAGMDYGVWEGGKKPADRKVTVASIQVLQRSRQKIGRYLPSDIPLIIGDEADLLITEKRRDFLDGFQGLKFGFSATDTWPDGRSISDYWGDTIFRYNLSEAIADGVVHLPKYQLLQSSVSMDALPKDSGEYPLEELDRVLVEAEVYAGIVEVYDSLVGREKMKSYPTIVVVPSVNLVRRTSQEFRKKYGRDIAIRWWTGEDSTGNTVHMDIEDYKGGEVDVLIVCEMGGRGMNLPNARLMIDASCTASLTKLSQRHPRVMRRDRKNPERKPDCIIIQILPNTRKSKPKTFFDLLDSHGSTGESSGDGVSPGEIKLHESLAPDVLERLRESIKTEGNHSLKLVDSIEMESEKVYELNEEGALLFEDGELYATIEYFMGLFGITTASLVKERIQKYQKQGAKAGTQRENKRAVNILITGKVQLKTVYTVEPVKTLYEQEKRTTLRADSSGCYTDPYGKKYYGKTELRRITGVRANDDYFSGLIPVKVLSHSTNQQMYYYGFDAYVAEITKSSVPPNSEMAYIWNGEYQDMQSLERQFPELSQNFTPKDFNPVLRHKPWDSEEGHIEYIWLVRIADVAQMYSYIASLPEVGVDGSIIWEGDDYLSPDAIEGRYKVEQSVLERSLGRRMVKVPAKIGWKSITVSLKRDLDEAFSKFTIKKTNVSAAGQGICEIEGETYYTTSHIAGLYGFSNQQVIEVFRAYRIEAVTLYGVKVHLYRQTDVERIFSKTELYPNSDEELHIDGVVYIDEKYLRIHYSERIAQATMMVVPGTMIQTKTGYRIHSGTKKGYQFYQKELTLKVANGIKRSLQGVR